MNYINKLVWFNEQKYFDKSMYLFLTNDLVRIHNKKLVKLLNIPIAISIAIKTHIKSNMDYDTNQLFSRTPM